MTFVPPEGGEPAGLSFIIPRTREDLERRRVMMLHWARATCGMMGRSPDFMNVTYAAWAGAADYFAAGRPEFGENMRRYHRYIRDNDLTLTHSLINLQRSRTVSGLFNLQEGTALQVMRETDAGIVVRGARMLATLGPISDEIGVYSPRAAQHTEGHSPFVMSFAIPCGTPGLRFLCRESFDLGRSHFDHPLGSRFEEMDCIVFFDDVLVPWERVFLLYDVDRLNNTAQRTHSSAHSAHQGAAKNLAKCEFVLGLALLMTETLGNAHLPGVEERLAELMLHDRADEGLHARRRGGCEAGRMGRDVPRHPADREHAQPVHDRLSADGGDRAIARLVEFHADPEREGPGGAAGRAYRAIPGDRQHPGAGAGQAVPSRLGRGDQRVRQPPGVVRTFLRQRSADPRAGAERDIPEAGGQAARAGLFARDED